MNQTFKIQFLLKFFIELFSVELGVCTLKIKVTFKLDCVFLNISWTVLPSGTISCSPIAYVEKKKTRMAELTNLISSLNSKVAHRHTEDKGGRAH